jgi:hypothetical protein
VTVARQPVDDGPARATAWAVVEGLAELVRDRLRVHQDAHRASLAAIRGAGAAHASLGEALAAWRALTSALVDGAGQDRAPSLDEALAAAWAVLGVAPVPVGEVVDAVVVEVEGPAPGSIDPAGAREVPLRFDL